MRKIQSLCAFMLLSASVGSAQFIDVSGDVAGPARTLYQRGVTSGYSLNMYQPGYNITRGQMAVFIVRAIQSQQTGSPDNFTYTTTPYFSDVPTSHQFYKWIQKLRDYGITSGCDVGLFCPDGNVTNGQMATFVVRARQIMQGMPISAPDCTPYIWNLPCSSINAFVNDTSSDYAYFRDYINYLWMIQGPTVYQQCTINGSFCADWPITRGQAAMDIVLGAWKDIPLAAPAIDYTQVTSTPPSGSLLPWALGYTGWIQVVYTTPLPFVQWAQGCIGSMGPGSCDIFNNYIPYSGPGDINWIYAGTAPQVYVQAVTAGGYIYDWVYHTPLAVGQKMTTTNLIDATPGFKTTVPPNAIVAKPPVAGATTRMVTMSNGKQLAVGRGDLVQPGTIIYSFDKDRDAWKYGYTLDSTGAMSVHLGLDMNADLATSETGQEPVRTPHSVQPSGWVPFLFTGWRFANFRPDHKIVEGPGARFEMVSDRLPGPIAISVQGDYAGLRGLIGHRPLPESQPVRPPIGEIPVDKRTLDQVLADHRAVTSAAHWLNNSHRQVVIGPAIPRGSGPGEIVVMARGWVDDLGLEFLRPLVEDAGKDPAGVLAAITPASEFERDVLECLKQALSDPK